MPDGVSVSGNNTGISNEANGTIIGTDGDGNGDNEERNIIVRSDLSGVFLDGVEDAVVAGNYLGVKADGVTPAANARGVKIVSDLGTSSGNRIGTDGDGQSDILERNVISGNNTFGITLEAAEDTIIKGNYIGIAADGISASPNTSHGINLSNGTVNTSIGSDTGNTDEYNIITNNGGDGIYIEDATSDQNSIYENSIYNNGGIAIDLDPDGEDLNDVSDTDTGPNEQLNKPRLTSLLISGNNVIIEGYTRPGATLLFFTDNSNEGQTFVDTFVEGSGDDFDSSTGSDTEPATGGDNSAAAFRFTLSGLAVPVIQGKNVTAIALDSNGNTSEFSIPISKEYYTLSGVVFEDTNYAGGDGTDYESGTDHPLENAYLELYTHTGSHFGTTITSATGYYIFSGIDAGTGYALRVQSASLDDSDTLPEFGLNAAI